MSSGDDFTKKVIEKFRVQLLDLSKRNNLISFKHTNKSTKQIRALDEVLTNLFEKLVSEESLGFKCIPLPDNIPDDEKNEAFERKLKDMRLTDAEFQQKKTGLGDEPSEREYLQLDLWLRDKARKELGLKAINRKQTVTIEEQAIKFGIEPSYELNKKSNVKKHTDNYIQTLLYPEQLDRRLKSIHEQSRLYESEAGINVLYMAFGFLEWYDTDSSTTKVTAPLILVPISITRELKKGEYFYNISLRDDEVSHNLCFAEKLKRNFDVQLPAYNGDLEQYLTDVSELIKSKADWKVKRFATIGFFAFSKISMYQDLSPENWNDTKFNEESLVYSLVNGKEQSEVLFADDYEIDTKKLNVEVPLTITDADSSQISAILDVLAGKDLVIEGPPGTGKSQTITNIIAAALEKNKKVLFISEKKAALEVVKNRLDKAGLGVFCLELHSSKAKRGDVSKSIEESLSLRKKSKKVINIDQEVNEIERIKFEIKKYISTIHGEYQPLESSYQNMIWNYLKLGKDQVELTKKVEHSRIENYKGIDKIQLRKAKSEIRKFVQYSKEAQVGSENFFTHVWKPFTMGSINAQNSNEFLVSLSDTSRVLTSFYEEFGATKIFGDGLEVLNLDDAQKAHTFLEDNHHLDISKIDMAVFSQLKDKGFFSTLCEYLENEKHLNQQETSLKTYTLGSNPEKTLDLLSLKVMRISPQDELNKIALNDVDKTIVLNKSKAEQLRDSKDQVEGMLSTLGLRTPRTKKEFQTLKAFILDLKEIPDFVLIHKSESLCAFDSKALVLDLKKSNQSLVDTKTSLKMRFNERSLKLCSRDVLPLIEEYKNYNLLSWFKASFRNARKAYREVCTDYDLQRSGIISSLERLYLFHQEMEKHLVSQAYLKLVKQPSLGLEAPVEEIEKTIDVMNDFMVKYPEHDNFSQMLQEVVTKSNGDGLQKARRLLSHKDVLVLIETILEILNIEKQDSIESCLKDLDGKIKSLETFNEFESRFELRGEITIGQVYDLCSLLNSYSARINARATYKATLPIIKNQSSNNVFELTINVYKLFSEATIPSALKNFIMSKSSNEDLKLIFEVFPSLKACTNKASFEVKTLFDKWGLKCTNLFSQDDFSKVPVHQLITSFMGLLNNKNLLLPSMQLKESEEVLLNLGLKGLIRNIVDEKMDFDNFEHLFIFSLYQTILQDFFNQNYDLKKNAGVSLMELRRLFREQDKKLSELQRHKLHAQLLKNEVEDGNARGKVKEYSEMGFISHQISLQRGHAPIRDYFSRAPESTLAIKPCLMMSPLSISQYLPSQDFYFDLVVMDEASQLKPEDALGAILRAKQVVVVGDPKQLPPTNFFNFSSEGSQQNDDEDEVELPEYESILDMALKSFRPARRLKWHYRSKHESLISFSNSSFYEGDLVIFPSPHYEHEDFGLHYKYIENGVYQGRKNLIEAQEIIKYVCSHVETNPNRSLGIVTVNQAQQELVNDLLEVAMRENVILQNFFIKHENSLEPLIVKNLENIQGDERDVILISTVYGKEPGATKFHQRFGPINGKMGHRRLNVLFTRARYKTLVFSSLDPDHIVADDSSSLGLRVFKDFLSFAKHKKVNVVTSTGEADSDFEIFVKRAIEEHGFKVHSQIGVSGYRIDLGIVHPNSPGKYLIGIECDGATYHSSKSARDRDKIRQEILESLGWNIYRIWSTDWFNDPKKEILKLLEEIKKIV